MMANLNSLYANIAFMLLIVLAGIWIKTRKENP